MAPATRAIEYDMSDIETALAVDIAYWEKKTTVAPSRTPNPPKEKGNMLTMVMTGTARTNTLKGMLHARASDSR